MRRRCTKRIFAGPGKFGAEAVAQGRYRSDRRDLSLHARRRGWRKNAVIGWCTPETPVFAAKPAGVFAARRAGAEMLAELRGFKLFVGMTAFFLAERRAVGEAGLASLALGGGDLI